MLIKNPNQTKKSPQKKQLKHLKNLSSIREKNSLNVNIEIY